jgi:3D-(3,5/4)-trihydroxycyclohexane-1,2-dione acylhydrolase (decyclizing)
VMIGAAGSTPGDLLKLWRQPRGGSTHIEFGFSCMGHEIPAGIGYRLALRDTAGEVYVMIGDGTYLMANTDLVTAVQDGTKITVILVVNDGFQSIHGLQRRTTAASMGTEFRVRDAQGGLDGAPLTVDYATNARSMGCAAFDVDSPDDLASALGKARELAGPAVIVVRVQPLAELPASGAWWDLGVARASERPEVRQIAAEHERQRRHQRFYG